MCIEMVNIEQNTLHVTKDTKHCSASPREPCVRGKTQLVLCSTSSYPSIYIFASPQARAAVRQSCAVLCHTMLNYAMLRYSIHINIQQYNTTTRDPIASRNPGGGGRGGRYACIIVHDLCNQASCFVLVNHSDR